MPTALINEIPAQLFSCEFCKIFKNTFRRKTPPLATSDHHHYRVSFKVFIAVMSILTKQIFSIIPSVFYKCSV